MRTEAIDRRLQSILSRLSPPRSIAHDTDAQRAEVAAMRKALNSACPTKGYDDWLDAFEEALFSKLETRAWPTLREVKKASQIKSGASRGDEMDEALKWFNTTGRAHPVFNSPQITAEILRRGMVADIREARWRGCDLTMEDGQRALKMRPQKCEWDHHIRVLSELRGQQLRDCEAQEIAEMSPDQLPLHLANLEAAE